MLLEGQKVGAIAFYWRNWPEQKEYWVGLTFGDKLFVNHGLYLRSALEEVGWIDEDNYMFYHADSDLSLKLWQAGFTVADCPRSFVEHFAHANKSIRKENLGSQQDDWRNYLERWKNVFYDPIQLNMGKWIYLDHVDKAHTATTFPFLNRLAASNRYKYENFKKTRIKPVIKQIKHFWNTYIKRIIRRF
jgi:GT2 family glycosyltransferase